jgi:hypothetical protein
MAFGTFPDHVREQKFVAGAFPRNASESQVYRDRSLASIRDRLGTAPVKEKALGLCQELFIADGARSDEEDDVFQNLRRLLE